MRWRGRRESRHVEDQRGRTRIRGRRGGISLGGLLLLLAASWLFGLDPLALLSGIEQAQVSTNTGSLSLPETAPPSEAPPREDDMKKFVSVVLADTETMWHTAFSQAGETYREPTLVLFSGSVQSACGLGQAAMGPFYCPADQKVYIDLSFYDDLRTRFGAPGDFAQAYVIAHEVGHHVQNLMGISDEVSRQQRQLSEVDANRLSVSLELQADCFAGVWGYDADNVRGLLEHGDIEEGLRAAAAIGDDRLQKQSQGYVTPDSFTHGSSEQRVKWFRAGFESGDIGGCNTFASGQP